MRNIVIVLLIAACGACYFARDWWDQCLQRPITVITTPGSVKVVESPPVLSVAKLSELVTLKVEMKESLEAQNNWYQGTWLIVGDALLSIDCSQAHMTAIRPEEKSFTMILPEPHVVSCRVNHEFTKTLSLHSISWNPAQLVWGNREEIREEGMKQAQRKLERCADTHENRQQARRHAEAMLGRLYGELGWKITFEWRPTGVAK